MSTHTCGAIISYNQNFCNKCGKPVIIRSTIDQIKADIMENQISYIMIIFSLLIILYIPNIRVLGVIGIVIGIYLMNHDKSGFNKFEEVINEQNNVIANQNNVIISFKSVNIFILIVLAFWLLSWIDLFVLSMLITIISLLLYYILSPKKIKLKDFNYIMKRSKIPLLIAFLGPYNLFWFLYMAEVGFLTITFDIVIFILIIFIGFPLLSILVYYAQPINEIRDHADKKKYIPLILIVLGISSTISDAYNNRYVWMFLFPLAAISMLFFPQIDNSKVEYIKEVDKFKQPILPIFKPLRTKVPKKKVIYSAHNKPVVNSVKVLEDELNYFENKTNKISSAYNQLIQNIKEIESDIGTLENDQLSNLELRERLSLSNRILTRLNKTLNYWDMEWNNLKIEYINQDIDSIINGIETRINEIRDKIPVLNKKITENSLLIFDQSPDDLRSTIEYLKNRHKAVDDKFTSSFVKKYDNDVVKQTIMPQQPAKKKIEDEKIVSFKLRSLISEKIVSNFFAYIGASFLVSGFFYFLLWAYDNIILINFPFDVNPSQAWFGMISLYIIAGIFVFNSMLITKLSSKLISLSRVIASLGLILFQFSFFIQTIYFINLDLNGYFFIIPSIMLVISSLFIGYRQKSQIVSVTGIGIGMYVCFISGASFTRSGLLLMNDTFIGTSSAPIILTIFNLLLLFFSIILVINKKVWIPLALFSLLSPVLWLQIGTNIATPEFLSLFIASANIGLIIGKKMPTARPFAHSMGLFYLIYNNIISINFTINELNLNADSLSAFQLISIMIIYSSFYALYWLFVMVEKDLDLSFDIPIGINFSKDNMRLRSFHRRLNWLMLSSLGFLLLIVLILLNYRIFEPVIYFAIMLSISAILGIKLGFDKIVRSSIILILIEAELFYLLSLTFPNADTLSNAIISAIFMVVFLFLFYSLSNSRDNLHLFHSVVSPSKFANIIAIVSIFNFLMAAESKNFDTLVLVLSTLSWISVSSLLILRNNKDLTQVRATHASVVYGLLYQFIFALVRQSRRFPISSITKNMDAQTHIAINLSISAYLIFAVISVYFGDILSVEQSEKSEIIMSGGFIDNLKQLISKDHIYLPQIIMFSIPSILITFGMPYFYYPTINQAILILYFNLYFLLLPIMILLSNYRNNSSFGPLAGFTGYFAFIGGFILLGGAKKLHDIIIQPPPSNARGVYFIAPEWAIFLILCVFIITVSWVIILSNRVLNVSDENTEYRKSNVLNKEESAQ